MRRSKRKRRDDEELVIFLPPENFGDREVRVNAICEWLNWIEDPTTEPATKSVLENLIKMADPEEFKDALERKSVGSTSIPMG